MRRGVIGGVLLAGGAVCVAVGILPLTDVLALWNRVWTVLLFVVAMTVVTELAASAGVFTAVAAYAVRWGRGSGLVLWLITAAGAALCTVFLSVDTTAVLLTPVVVGLARHARMDPVPFAVTVVWMANTGSLLLPVSNLTNLLAQRSVAALSLPAFVTLTATPAVVAAALPASVVLVVMRRRIHVAYRVVAAPPATDATLLHLAAAVVVVLLPLLVSGAPVWVPACMAAAVMIGVFVVRRPTVLKMRLIPWRLVMLAAGLFVGVQMLHELGLTAALTAATGTGTGLSALMRMSFAGAVGANAVNNLPAYLAFAPVAAHATRSVALLIGVNAGALVTPWASLATLLWRDRLTTLGVIVRWRRLMLWSAPVAAATVGLATVALWLTA